MTELILPPRCDRAAAAALLPELLAAPAGAPIAIDARHVEHVGQAMLQVLVSARRSGAGATIAASPALADCARRLGLAAALFDEAAA